MRILFSIIRLQVSILAKVVTNKEQLGPDGIVVCEGVRKMEIQTNAKIRFICQKIDDTGYAEIRFILENVDKMPTKKNEPYFST